VLVYQPGAPTPASTPRQSEYWLNLTIDQPFAQYLQLPVYTYARRSVNAAHRLAGDRPKKLARYVTTPFGMQWAGAAIDYASASRSR